MGNNLLQICDFLAMPYKDVSVEKLNVRRKSPLVFHIDVEDKCIINICIAADEKYIEPTVVLISSILIHAHSSDDVRFYILDGGISETGKKQIDKLKIIKRFSCKYININKEAFQDCPITPDTHFNIVNYYRLRIPSLLPEIDKMIYLDSDIIVKKSLRDLWCVDLSNNCLAGAISVTSEKNSKRLQLPDGTPYINSGVLVVNCKFWRDNGIEQSIFEYIKKAPPEKMLNVDQDAINGVLYNSIYYLDQHWNVETRTDIQYPASYEIFLNNPYIIHYVSQDKPWHECTKQDTSEYNKFLYISGLQKTVQMESTNSAEAVLADRLIHRIANLDQAVNERDLQIVELAKQVEESRQTINEIRQSTSWRLTAPLRFLGNLIREV